MADIEPVNSSTYRIRYVDDAEAEIGDIKAADFRPQVKLKRWGEECFFTLGLPTAAVVAPTIEGQKLKWKALGQELNFYPLEPRVIEEAGFTFSQMELGGFEFEIVLGARPLRNVFTLNVETKGLVFYRQQPFTPAEIADGCYQPENVVGSIAVYHATKMHGRYKTGKAFHIYRPKAIDSIGQEVWGELKLDEVAGTLSIIIPQTWLDSAVYPVFIDPTVGFVDVGGNAHNLSDDYVYAAEIGNSGVDSGALSILSGYVTFSASPAWGLALYDGSATSPGNLEDYTAEQTGGTSGTWHDLANTQSYNVESSEDYWIAIWTADAITAYHDNGAEEAAYAIRYDSEIYSYPNWPSVHSDEGGWTGRRYSFHMDFAAANPTAAGTPSIASPTSTGTANLRHTASGSPSIPSPTATGNALKQKTATGTPSIPQPTATGSASITAVNPTATGTPSIPSPTATGTAFIRRKASGTPSAPQPTATGSATISGLTQASGSPSIPSPTATGTAYLRHKASGAPALEVLTATGTATRKLICYGSPSIPQPTATGNATLGTAATQLDRIENLLYILLATKT